MSKKHVYGSFLLYSKADLNTCNIISCLKTYMLKCEKKGTIERSAYISET